VATGRDADAVGWPGSVTIRVVEAVIDSVLQGQMSSGSDAVAEVHETLTTPTADAVRVPSEGLPPLAFPTRSTCRVNRRALSGPHQPAGRLFFDSAVRCSLSDLDCRGRWSARYP
jgi:hypothetical protein